MVEDSKLIACANCGSAKVRLVKKSGITGKVCRSRYYREHIECKDCGARSGEFKSPGKAIVAWNRRAAPEETIIAWRYMSKDGQHWWRYVDAPWPELWGENTFIREPLFAAAPVNARSEGEPIAWLCEGEKAGAWKEARHVVFDAETVRHHLSQPEYWTVTPLYATPPPPLSGTGSGAAGG